MVAVNTPVTEPFRDPEGYIWMILLLHDQCIRNRGKLVVLVMEPQHFCPDVFYRSFYGEKFGMVAAEPEYQLIKFFPDAVG